MNYRIAEILAAEDLGANGTKTIALNFSEIASRLRLRYKFTNGTPLINIAHPAECLTKIEIVDGSEVLYSLSGQEAQAMNFYDKGKSPHNVFNVDTSQDQYTFIDIDFGRFLWDTELGLNLDPFDNPQLKVTYDEDAANTSGSAGTLEVLGFLFDDKSVSPTGFFRNTEHYTYTPSASAHEYVELPSDYVLRKMLLRTYTTDVDPVVQMDSIKLSENQGKKIPLDISWRDLAYMNIDIFGLLSEYCTMDLVVTATDWYVTPSYLVQVNPVNTGDVTTGSAEFPGITIANTHVSLSASITCIRNKTYVAGYAPHNVLALPFGDQMDIGDWYDIASLKSLRADLLPTSDDQSGGEVCMILQQLRPY